jgi:hypothetical protein
MGWSMDRQGIRTSFDRESRRLKQVELSGSRRERVSLRTCPNELSAREAEVCQNAKYGEWCEPIAPPAAGSSFDNSKIKSGESTATAVDKCPGDCLRHLISQNHLFLVPTACSDADFPGRAVRGRSSAACRPSRAYRANLWGWPHKSFATEMA